MSSISTQLTYEVNETKLQMEALIFLAGNSIKLDDLHHNFKEIPHKQIAKLLKQLQGEYEDRAGAFELVFLSKETVGFRLKDALHRDPMLKSFTTGKEFTPIEMKTLAFVGYYQPVEKLNIVELVGRGSPKAIKNLTIRGFISATKEEYSVLNAKGEDMVLSTDVFTTTTRFAEYFGVHNDIDNIKEWIEDCM